MNSLKQTRWLIAVALVFALIATACGGSDRSDEATTTDVEEEVDETPDPETETTEPATDDPADETDDEPETTEPEAVDPCEGVTLEATDIGVSADTITVVAMADVGSPLAPGLFKGAWDGVDAWAKYVNANGGLACRQVEVIQADSMLNAVETTNGFLRACESALALVGTSVLFGSDVSDLNNCPDGAGNPIGVPDLAYIATEIGHGCSSTSFHMNRPGAECPYESGPRNSVAAAGLARWLLENVNPDLKGLHLVPADLPSTIATAIPLYLAAEAVGVEYVGTPGVSARSTQAEYAPVVQTLTESGSNYVYNGGNDATMIAMRKEAAAQGLNVDSIIWACSLSCYTPDFIEQGGADVENTYVWMPWVPFEEADSNEELGHFMDNIGVDFPPAWAAGAWADGQLLAEAVDTIVATDGPNAVTRASVLEALRVTDTFDANGWWGAIDLTTTNTQTNCIVILQVQNGEYVRVFPEERGTLSCDPANVVDVVADPAEFNG